MSAAIVVVGWICMIFAALVVFVAIVAGALYLSLRGWYRRRAEQSRVRIRVRYGRHP
ncbi:hypothetical protein [Amycolatopsis sp. DSM 110486]|uniref:hypothetical protein n=1 Tax=Amycolatopsis sp. DSM 110486 TaxID=2865832 RepID=UPI001C695071|nr:hypothetical protein [Amycolatopsis sp. DSM 110486]QYN17574.1 hypothetical protein K1T34_32840 [Amycolatopsis sp. DSM 110486]